MPCSGSGGQPEVRQRLQRPMEFTIEMTRQVMRQDLGPAACLVVPTAAAACPVGVKLLIKQADAALHLPTPLLQQRLLLGGVLHLPVGACGHRSQVDRPPLLLIYPAKPAQLHIQPLGRTPLTPGDDAA